MQVSRRGGSLRCRIWQGVLRPGYKRAGESHAAKGCYDELRTILHCHIVMPFHGEMAVTFVKDLSGKRVCIVNDLRKFGSATVL